MGDVIEKLPYEKFPRCASFERELVPDETIQSYTVECISTETGASTLATMVSGTISQIGPRVFFVVQNGNLNEQHKITVRVATSLNNIYEKDIFVEIRDLDTDFFNKQPTEEFSISNDFSNDLEPGDSITSHTVTATKLSDNSDATDIVIEGSGVLDMDVRLQTGVFEGQDGDYYRLFLQIGTAIGYKYEKRVTLILQEI